MGGCRVRHLGFGFRQKSALLGPYTGFCEGRAISGLFI